MCAMRIYRCVYMQYACVTYVCVCVCVCLYTSLHVTMCVLARVCCFDCDYVTILPSKIYVFPHSNLGCLSYGMSYGKSAATVLLPSLSYL